MVFKTVEQCGTMLQCGVLNLPKYEKLWSVSILINPLKLIPGKCYDSQELIVNNSLRTRHLGHLPDMLVCTCSVSLG